MDITPVLLNCSAMDPRARDAASAQLAQFAQSNLVRAVAQHKARQERRTRVALFRV